MRRRMTIICTGVALAACSAAATILAPAAAAAVPGMPTVHYQVTLSGSQTTTWSLDHTTYDGCVQGDVRTTGTGRQHVTFATAAPARVTALRIDGTVVLSANGAAGVPLKGSVDQQTSTQVQQLSGGESGCGGVDAPTAPTAPDCGTRDWTGTVQPLIVAPDDYPALVSPLTSVLHWDGPSIDGMTGFDDLYANCPAIVGSTIAPTPQSWVLEHIAFARPTTFVVRGSDTTESTENGLTQQVTVNWAARFVPAGAAAAVQPCTVPKLAGLTVPAARRALRRAKCRIGAVRRVYDSRRAKGRVVRSTPMAGRRTTAKVTLLVSKGAKPRR